MNKLLLGVILIMTAIFQITDGVTTVDFISPDTGLHLEQWNRTLATWKGGGVFQGSPLSEGRQMVYNRLGNAFETIVLKANATSQDDLIETEQKTIRLLNQAVDYWITNDFSVSPVYIKAKAHQETSTRYAIICNWTIPQLGNQFEQPYLQPGCMAALDDFDLILERQQWLDNVPGTGTARTITTETESVSVDWAVLTSTPTDTRALIELGTGTLLAGDNSQILRSTDSGATWVAVGAAVVGDIQDFEELSNGYVLAADGTGSGKIFRSIDDGATWTQVYNSVFVNSVLHIEQLNNGDVLASVDQTTTGVQMVKSTDNGATWGAYGNSFDDVLNATKMTYFEELVFADGTVKLIGLMTYINAGDDDFYVVRSNNAGLDWSVLLSFTDAPTDNENKYYMYSKVESETKQIIYITAFNARINLSIRSNNDLYLYDTRTTTNEVAGGYYDTSLDTLFLVNESGEPLRSLDDGLTAETLSTVPSGVGRAILSLADDETILIANTADVWWNNPNGVTTGITGENVFIINKHVASNITNWLSYDGVGYTEQIGSLTGDLQRPSTTGYIYYGSNDTYSQQTPFSALLVNVSDSWSISTAVTSVVEYYNGAWVALTLLRDNTDVAGYSFSIRDDIGAIVFEAPSDWTQTTIDGVNAYWIRFSISAGAYTQQPESQTNSPHFINKNYIEIDAADTGGDITSLLKLVMANITNDGSSSDWKVNRVIAGVRSVSRGDDFSTSLYPIAPNNIDGVVATLGTDMSTVANTQSPNGQSAKYTSTVADTMADRVTWDIPSTVSKSFFGVFRAFIRVKDETLSSDTVKARIGVKSGSGSPTVFNDAVRLTNVTDDFVLVDLGRVTIPSSRLAGYIQNVDKLEIILQMSNSAVKPVYVYDLLLVPADEFIIDSTDTELSTDSSISALEQLHIDSISDPKQNLKSQVEAGGNFKASWQPISPTQATISPNVTQRIYFVLAEDGGDSSWVSNPSHVYRVSLQTQQRYLSARGQD